MELTIYRRHAADCTNPNRCRCPIWVDKMENGKRIRQSLKTRNMEEAYSRKRQLERGESTPAPTPIPKQHSLAKIITLYLDSCEIAATTKVSYKGALDLFNQFCQKQGIFTLDQLTKLAVNEHLKVEIKHLGGRTRILHYRILRTFFNYCCEMELLPRSPLPQRHSVRLADSEAEAHRPLSHEEIDALFAACIRVGQHANTTPELQAILMTFYCTGLRISDVRSLNWSNLDPIKRTLHIKPQKTLNRTRTEVFIPNLPAKLFEALRVLPRRIDGLVFERSNRNTLNPVMRNLFKRAKVDGSAHDLRCTFAVTRLKEGIPIEDVSRMLGHANIAMTQRYYAKWIPELSQRIVRAMELADFSRLDRIKLG